MILSISVFFTFPILELLRNTFFNAAKTTSDKYYLFIIKTELTNNAKKAHSLSRTGIIILSVKLSFFFPNWYALRFASHVILNV